VHHEDVALVTDAVPSNTSPAMGSRYDDQIAVLGKDFMARVRNMKIFMVGCGALGCEYLKGLAMMGACAGNDGKLWVTDMDIIEVSNLSRQFLFRTKDVGHSKSISAAGVITGWNPDINIDGIEKFVGTSTEDFFSDTFWDGLDLCWNALDNVKARKYTDGRCLWYSKPLLESGTTGTMSNHEVILPYRTRTYNDAEEQPEVGIAMCTLKSFPFLPLHCIEFAKQMLFQEMFEFGPEQYETFRSDKEGFYNQLKAMSSDTERVKALKAVETLIDAQTLGTPVDFNQCITMAFGMLMSVFRNKIMDVCAAGDAKHAETGDYWAGTKRRPNPVDFTPEDKMSMEFLFATANMYAFIFKVQQCYDLSAFDAMVRTMNLTQLEHNVSGADVDVEGEDESESTNAPEEIKKIKAKLDALELSQLSEGQAHDFEKDDDSNFHIDFLTASTNLRSWNYNIKVSDRKDVKVIAGRIIAALATTTAMVCGLVDIEFCKIVLGLQNLGIQKFLESNINLANGSNNFTVFEPSGPHIQETGLKGAVAKVPFETFTTWDKIEIHEGSMSVAGLVQYLEETYGAKALSLAAEINYNPGKSIPLWREGEDSSRKLSAIFEEKCASGAATTSRSGSAAKRVRSELKDLIDDPVGGCTVAMKPTDDFVFHVTIAGPEGSPFEGGTFLLEITCPDAYPVESPKLQFVTQIDHCNIDGGVPCPDLTSTGNSWSPASNIKGVLMLLMGLLKEQDMTKPLRDDLATMDEAARFAKCKATTEAHATADQQFSVDEVSDAPAGKPTKWFHHYLAIGGGHRGGIGGCGGEFVNATTGEDVQMPRIELIFKEREHAAAASAAEEETATEAAPAWSNEDATAAWMNTCDIATSAKIAAATLDLDGDVLEPLSCYKLSADRCSRYSTLTDGLTVENGVCVTCKNGAGEIVEAVVKVDGDSVEMCYMEDPIMFSMIALPALVEAQFEPDGEWVLSQADVEGCNGEKGVLFGSYSKMVSNEQPDCIAALRRMLQAGPVNKMYTAGGNPKSGIPSHCGFSLRMPPAEVENWTMTNDKGELQDLPRMCHALRVWDAATRSYTAVDPYLVGAPKSAAELDQWFAGVIKTLKGSPYLGADFVDEFGTSERHTFDPALGRPSEFFGKVDNHWTQLILATK